jgi:hypothetical protein
LRFRLREALRPLELERLLSLGALVEESLSTRLDSVRAPDLLCVDEERLDPDARLRELAFERLLDEEERPEEERPFDFDEERPLDFDEELLEPPERLLVLDRELPWAILPCSSWIVRYVSRGYPNPTVQTRKNPTVAKHALEPQFK